MPWDHCDQTLPDDVSCPACGLSKAEWTVQTDHTRVFQVSRAPRQARDGWLELELRDAGGAPVAAAEYRVVLPGGRVKKGELDDQGLARLEELPHGTCKVSFPGRLDEPQERDTGARHVFGGGRWFELEVWVDPAELDQDDRYVLASADGRYERALSVLDDRIPGDGKLTLRFTDLVPGATYSLVVRHGAGDDCWERRVFRDRPYDDLIAEA